MIYIFLQPMLYISCRRQLTPSGSLRSPPTPETGVGKGCSDAVPFSSINLPTPALGGGGTTSVVEGGAAAGGRGCKKMFNHSFTASCVAG